MTLIGMSADSIGRLHQFSTQKAYEPALVHVVSVGATDRISYVIAPHARVAYACSDLNPDKPVENTSAAVRELQAKARK